MRHAAQVIIVVAVLGSVPAMAQDGLTVLGADEEPKTHLYEWLLGECEKHFALRRKEVLAQRDPEQIRARQKRLRGRFIKAIGGFPERTPLNPRKVGEYRGDGFRIEKIIYESRPGHHVTANLYLPDASGPVPGILVPCGHTANGKIGYQKINLLLVKHGFAVLCYDPIGQGERYQVLDDKGKPRFKSTSEHTMVTVGALPVGWCGASYRIWDGIRSLDYLESRPEVDAKRLGCTGNSGGGLMTSLLMALDPRIGPAAPGCYITSLEQKFAKIGPADGEQTIPGQVGFGMNHPDFITMRAPKPTLILAATQDFVPIEGTWPTYREAKRVYGVMGYAERVDLFEFNDKHGYSKPRREAALRWMRRWLMGIDDAPVEPELPVLAAEDLNCTKTGQVLTSLGGRSVRDLAEARVKTLAARRRPRVTDVSREEFLALLHVRLGVKKAAGAPPVKRGGALKREGYTVQKVVFETEPGLKVPALVYEPDGKSGAVQILYVHGGGKAEGVEECEAWVGKGLRVVAPDIRGMGETAAGGGRARWRSLFGLDNRPSLLSLRLGRPFLGQRVGDVLAVVEWMASTSGAPIRAIGVETGGLPVLHAAVLDPRIEETEIVRSLSDWASVSTAPVCRDQMGGVVHGALEDYDLPELAGRIAPRRLRIRSALDPQWQAVPLEAMQRIYAPCFAAYRKAGALDNLSVTR